MEARLEEHSLDVLSTKPPQLALWPLVALIFFETCGGPFGTEEAVAAGGPLLTLVGVLVLPLVWSLPEALLVAELATAFPEDTGNVAWVSAAFSPFWGFQIGWLIWLSGSMSLTSYVALLLTYLDQVFPETFWGWRRIVFSLSFILLASYLNYRGLLVVGVLAVVVVVLILLPFVLLMGFCLPHVRPANWLVIDLPSVDWASFLTIMFWCALPRHLNYWDGIAPLAGEVAEPRKTFPRAMVIAVGLVTATYLLPTAASTGAFGTAENEWELGYFATVAQKCWICIRGRSAQQWLKLIGGWMPISTSPWLQWWILSAAFLMAFGMFQSSMSVSSFQLLGMAHRGYLPALLGHRSPHGTPTVGILISTLPVMGVVSFTFIDLLEIQNSVYIAALLMAFAAFLWLRFKAPALHRPYKVPVPLWGAVLMLIPATALHLIVLALPFLRRNWKVAGWVLAVLGAGAGLHPFLQFTRKRGWLRYEGDAPYAYAASLHGRSPYGDRSRSRPGVPQGSAEASKAVKEPSPGTQLATMGTKESCIDSGPQDSGREFLALDGLKLAKRQQEMV